MDLLTGDTSYPVSSNFESGPASRGRSKFDEALWKATVDSMIVHSEHRMNFAFKDGLKLVWKM